MIMIDGDRAEIRFPWPTNDTARGVLKMMSAQASATLAGHTPGRVVRGGIKFENIERTENGFEFVFSASLTPLEVPGE